MRLHTSGDNVVLLSPKVRLRWPSRGKLRSEEVPAGADISDYDRSGVLCITPSGDRDFSARLVASGAVAADAINDEEVAAAIVSEEGMVLVRGPLSMEGDWSSVLPIDGLEPKRVPWPAGLIWKKGDKSMYEMAEEHGTGIPGAFVPAIECNEHGTAIASPGSGTVVVFPHGQDAPSLCLQIPSQEEAVIFPTATEEGVLVSVIVDGQDSAYVHMDREGKVLGYRAAQCGCAAAVLREGFLVYDDDDSSLHLLDRKMKTKASLPIDFAPVDSAYCGDGSSFVFADADIVARGHVDAKGKIVLLDTLAYGEKAGVKSPGEVAAMEAKWDPERSEGPAAVGFAAGITPPPWEAKANGDFELILQARSTGGEGQGVAIEIGGDVMKHCEFSEVIYQGESFALEKKGNVYCAEIPELELPLGLAYPLNPKPKNDAQKHAAQLFLADTHLEFRVKGTCGNASADLMSVSIRALESDSPPLKWMRPLTIS